MFFFSYLLSMIYLIEKNEFNDWNKAKTIWILLVTCSKPNINLVFDIKSSAFESFIKYFTNFQKLEYFCIGCKREICDRKIFFISKSLENVPFINIQFNEKCKICSKVFSGKFVKKPFFLLI